MIFFDNNSNGIMLNYISSVAGTPHTHIYNEQVLQKLNYCNSRGTRSIYKSYGEVNNFSN